MPDVWTFPLPLQRFFNKKVKHTGLYPICFTLKNNTIKRADHLP